MTRQQNIKRAMYEAVLSLLETNSAKTSSNQGIAESEGRFSDLLEAINIKAVQVAQATVGKTAAKQAVRTELEGMLVTMTAALYALGRKTNDLILKARSDVTPSDLSHMRESDLVTEGNVILGLARANADALVVHGIVGEMVTALEGRIAGFREAIGDRQSSVAARIAGRKTLKELFAEVDRVLGEEIDKYLELFRLSDPEFYKAYFSARTIKNIGVRHEAQPALAAVQPQPDGRKAA